MKKEFFHIAPTMLSPGSIILPGNWGRVFKTHTVDKINPHIFIRESTFELIRSLEFCDKPSRLDALFAFDDIECARKFINEAGRQSEIIYRISVETDGVPMHRGSLHMGYDNTCGFYDHALEKAREYWRGDPTGYAEVVIAAGGTVIGTVT